MAFIQRQTITEMFCHTILDQLKILVMKNEIPLTDPNLYNKEQIFENII